MDHMYAATTSMTLTGTEVDITPPPPLTPCLSDHNFAPPLSECPKAESVTQKTRSSFSKSGQMAETVAAKQQEQGSRTRMEASKQDKLSAAEAAEKPLERRLSTRQKTETKGSAKEEEPVKISRGSSIRTDQSSDRSKAAPQADLVKRAHSPEAKAHRQTGEKRRRVSEQGGDDCMATGEPTDRQDTLEENQRSTTDKSTKNQRSTTDKLTNQQTQRLPNGKNTGVDTDPQHPAKKRTVEPGASNDAGHSIITSTAAQSPSETKQKKTSLSSERNRRHISQEKETHLKNETLSESQDSVHIRGEPSSVTAVGADCVKKPVRHKELVDTENVAAEEKKPIAHDGEDGGRTSQRCEESMEVDDSDSGPLDGVKSDAHGCGNKASESDLLKSLGACKWNETRQAEDKQVDAESVDGSFVKVSSDESDGKNKSQSDKSLKNVTDESSTADVSACPAAMTGISKISEQSRGEVDCEKSVESRNKTPLSDSSEQKRDTTDSAAAVRQSVEPEDGDSRSQSQSSSDLGSDALRNICAAVQLQRKVPEEEKKDSGTSSKKRTAWVTGLDGTGASPDPHMTPHKSSSLSSVGSYNPSSNSPVSVSTPKKNVQIPKAEENVEMFRIPLRDHGWKREVVVRGVYDKGETPRSDVYYITPDGRKLRSSVMISTYLQENHSPLTPNHFTFMKKSVYEEPFELVRQANRIGVKTYKAKNSPKSSPKTDGPPRKKAKVKITTSSQPSPALAESMKATSKSSRPRVMPAYLASMEHKFSDESDSDPLEDDQDYSPWMEEQTPDWNKRRVFTAHRKKHGRLTVAAEPQREVLIESIPEPEIIIDRADESLCEAAEGPHCEDPDNSWDSGDSSRPPRMILLPEDIKDEGEDSEGEGGGTVLLHTSPHNKPVSRVHTKPMARKSTMPRILLKNPRNTSYTEMKTGKNSNKESGKIFNMKKPSDVAKAKATNLPMPAMGQGQLCTYMCPGLSGVAPSLQCCVCMCLFHHQCVNINPHYSLLSSFKCSRCRAVVASERGAVNSVNVSKKNNVNRNTAFSFPTISTTTSTGPGPHVIVMQGGLGGTSMVAMSKPVPLQVAPAINPSGTPRLATQGSMDASELLKRLTNPRMLVRQQAPFSVVGVVPMGGPASSSSSVPAPPQLVPSTVSRGMGGVHVVPGVNTLSLPRLTASPSVAVSVSSSSPIIPPTIFTQPVASLAGGSAVGTSASGVASLGNIPSVVGDVASVSSVASVSGVGGVAGISVSSAAGVGVTVSGVQGQPQMLTVPASLLSNLNLNQPVRLKLKNQEFIVPPSSLIAAREGLKSGTFSSVKVMLPPGTLPTTPHTTAFKVSDSTNTTTINTTKAIPTTTTAASSTASCLLPVDKTMPLGSKSKGSVLSAWAVGDLPPSTSTTAGVVNSASSEGNTAVSLGQGLTSTGTVASSAAAFIDLTSPAVTSSATSTVTSSAASSASVVPPAITSGSVSASVTLLTSASASRTESTRKTVLDSSVTSSRRKDSVRGNLSTSSSSKNSTSAVTIQSSSSLSSPLSEREVDGGSVGGSSLRRRAKKKRGGVNATQCLIHRLHGGFDCMLAIFRYLDVPDLLRAGNVCRTWQRISQEKCLWQSVSLKGLRVRDWNRAGQFLSSVRTQALNLQVEPESDVTERERSLFLEGLKQCVCSLGELRRLVLGLVPAHVVHCITDSNACLTHLTAQHITDFSQEDIWTSQTKLDVGQLGNLLELRELRLRGVSSLALPRFSFSGSLSELASLKHLHTLSLTSLCALRESEFTFLANMRQLTSLELGDCLHWTDQTYELLGGLTELAHLRLEGGGWIPDCGLGDALLNLTKLERLELILFTIPASLASSLSQLPFLHTLVLWPQAHGHIHPSLVNSHALMAVMGLNQLLSLEWGVVPGPQPSSSSSSQPPADIISLMRPGATLDPDIDINRFDMMDMTISDFTNKLLTSLPLSTTVKVFKTQVLSAEPASS